MEQLQDFVRQKALPVVGEVTAKSLAQYTNARLPVVTVFTAVDHTRNPKGFQYVANRVRKAAVEFKGRVLFNVANTHDFIPTLEHYGFKDVHNNAILVGLVDENMYYAMDAPFSSEAVTSFVQAFRGGALVGKEVNKFNDKHIDHWFTLLSAYPREGSSRTHRERPGG
jgi:hypothetical protein